MLAEKNESGSRQTMEDEAALRRSLGFVGKVALFAVGAFLVLGFFIGVVLYNVVHPATSTEWKDLMQALGYLMAALAAISAGLAAVFGVIVTWRNIDRQLESARKNTDRQLDSARENTLEELKVAQKGQITERFTQAVEHLGKEEEVRIGGIYALERIALDSSEDYHWPVVEILTSYIRKRAKTLLVDAALESWQESSDEKYRQHQHPLPDVQAALFVLARREHKLDPPDKDRFFINLSHADLRYANLRNVHLEKARLRYTNLTQAMLREANFEKAILSHAHLDEAYLEGANLTGAKLRETTLNKARLHSKDALDGANLLEVTRLKQEKLERACGDGTTKLPVEGNIVRPAKWPTGRKD